MLRRAFVLYATLAAALFAARLAHLDDGTFIAVLVAAAPYLVPATAVLGAGLVVTRNRTLASVAAVLLVGQLSWLAPRFTPDAVVPTGGPPLRIGTVNAHAASVLPAAVVEIVRQDRLDVLAVQELSSRGITALDHAGLRELLPYRELHPEADSSIFSRHPLRRGGLLDRPTAWPQTYVEVVVGGRSVRIVTVHTHFPGDPQRWAADMAALRSEAAEAPRNLVMLGDFNATLDQSPMAALLATGLIDVHAELGRGAVRTWPADRWYPPLIPIDHVLHGQGLAATWVAERTLPGTDHRAIVTELRASLAAVSASQGLNAPVNRQSS